jgi:hypothetical protein
MEIYQQSIFGLGEAYFTHIFRTFIFSKHQPSVQEKILINT